MRRRHCVAVVLLLLTPAVRAQDAKPDMLTPQQAADGWIALFDGETTFGWHIEGEAKVDNGMLVLGGAEKTRAFTTAAFAPSYHLYYEIRGAGAKNALNVKGNAGFGYGGDIGPDIWHKLLVKCMRADGLIVATYFIHGKGGWNALGSSTAPERDKPSAPHQVFIEVPSGNSVSIRQMKIRSMGARSLFNANDLTGWKVFADKKSEFAVIDGAINLKNGPGDLQTEKKFGDFLLQLECISHGPHLNSGVFFRCRANEYQNGYEAQISNHFSEKPQKYQLEEYDPQTHKLIGKKATMFTAVDYGTGAIYRRQPARKQVAKDNEWFTMTVVAHGNHFATWVNGIQVTDWHDHRPPSDNARTGCRLEAGHISLQGHDPTTNLSFRNLRIQEYPTK